MLCSPLQIRSGKFEISKSTPGVAAKNWRNVFHCSTVQCVVVQATSDKSDSDQTKKQYIHIYLWLTFSYQRYLSQQNWFGRGMQFKRPSTTSTTTPPTPTKTPITNNTNNRNIYNITHHSRQLIQINNYRKYKKTQLPKKQHIIKITKSRYTPIVTVMLRINPSLEIRKFPSSQAVGSAVGSVVVAFMS